MRKRILPAPESTTGTAPISVRLPPRLRDDLQSVLEEGESYGEFVRLLIEEEVARRSRERRAKPKRAPRQGAK